MRDNAIRGIHYKKVYLSLYFIALFFILITSIIYRIPFIIGCAGFAAISALTVTFARRNSYWISCLIAGLCVFAAMASKELFITTAFGLLIAVIIPLLV